MTPKGEQLSDFKWLKTNKLTRTTWGRAQASRQLKGDRAPKKQKVSLESILGLMAEGDKMVTLAKQGGGKGQMIPSSGSQKKPPILLREDPKYALEKLSSIIGSEDYEDLGSHSTEAIRETGLFSIAQVNVCHALACLYPLSKTNSPTFSGHAHDEGVDGTVSPS